MTGVEKLTSSFEKSLGMLSVIPPVVAAGVTLKVVDKSFKGLSKKVKL